MDLLIDQDDGSTDRSREIIQSYSDPRIKVIINGKNLNLANSLNIGLKEAQGEYVVRMDADDISATHRLEEQLQYMEKNKEIVLSGTFIKIIGTEEVKSYPISHNECKLGLLFNSILVHPSTIMRKNFFIENNLFYNSEFERGQDYELWTRVVLLGKIGNLNKVLYYYRIKKEGTQEEDLKKIESAKHIREKYLTYLDIDFSSQELMLHNKISLGRGLSIKELLSVNDWFEKIKRDTRKEINYCEDCYVLLEIKRKSILSPKRIIKDFLKKFQKEISLF